MTSRGLSPFAREVLPGQGTDTAEAVTLNGSTIRLKRQRAERGQAEKHRPSSTMDLQAVQESGMKRAERRQAEKHRRSPTAALQAAAVSGMKRAECRQAEKHWPNRRADLQVAAVFGMKKLVPTAAA